VSQLTDFLGRQVKKRRKALKLSQEDVAAKTGLSIPSLSEIERGIANPTLLTMEKIADALGVSVASMLDADGVLVTSPEQMKLRVLEHLERMSLDQLKIVSGLLDISTK
jgi:transcriptional regulator with XRE-family HTH domain